MACPTFQGGQFSSLPNLRPSVSPALMSSNSHVNMSDFSNDTSGAILTLASSAACILGSLVICLDVVWRWIFPNSKFDLNNNQGFLICSLSLSSGVLLFTSMYKLLPQGLDYYLNSSLLKDSPRLANAFLIITYMLGIAICSAINAVIHALTSQSVVHCAHDGPVSDHGHSHGHSAHDEEQGPSSQHEDRHVHNHSHTYDSIDHSPDHTVGGNSDFTPDINYTRSDVVIPSHRAGDSEAPAESSTHDETTPLLEQRLTDSKTTRKPPFLRSYASETSINPGRRVSLIDITDWKIRGKKYMGKCMGYANVEECCDVCSDFVSGNVKTDPHTIFDYIEPDTMVHRHIHLDQSSAVAHAHDHGACRMDAQLRSGYLRNEPVPLLEGTSTDTEDQGEVASNRSLDRRPSDYPRSYHVHEEDDDHDHAEDDEDVHHHHISTRYSHLFSIGLQTAFAISVHKIPEGFLTFATTHADRDLGFNVFLALAIHNFSEGFTIAFPLFLALQSRTLAIISAVVLGGLSQPLGALLAWLLFKFQLIPSDEDGVGSGKTNLVFGLIVSITAGFLSIIGLQMYGTAISFGGRQKITLASAFIGIAIIGLASSLTAH